MWEWIKNIPRGRLSWRYYSLLTTIIVVVLLAITFVFSPNAFADDAIRNGNNISYGGNSYTPVDNSLMPANILQDAPNTNGYRYIESAQNKAHFMLVTGNASSASSGYYVVYDFTPPSNYSNPSPPINVNIVNDPNDPSANGELSTSDCDGSQMGGISWFVCPTVNFIARGMDMIYGVISSFLVVNSTTSDTDSVLYKLWVYVRDIANVAFVLAFIIIVYSQLTGLGLNNYGIKNILPRLIVAAILVNISFWICTLAVDISNLIGYSVHNMFMGIMDQFSVGANYTGDTPVWQQVSAALLGGGAAVGGTIFAGIQILDGGIYVFIPILLSAIIAALVALLVLATRQALITIFIIISPLAFVAYILPNTEKYFNKWRDASLTLLLLFPIFSFIFSGAQVAGMAIIQNASGNLFTVLLGLGAQVAPIVITPMLVKFSGGVISKVAGIVNNPNKGLVDRTKKWADTRGTARKNKILAGQTKYFRNNPAHKAVKKLDNYRRNRDGVRKVHETMADNRFSSTKQGHNLEAMNKYASNDKQRIDNIFNNSQIGRQLELQSRHLGVEKQEIDNSLLRSRPGQNLTYRQQMADIDKSRVSNEFNESNLGNRSDQSRRIVESHKKRIDNTLQASWDESVRTDATLNALELDVKVSELKASKEKVRLDRMHAEITAQGENSEHITNLRGLTPTLEQGILNISRNIKQEHLETSYTNMAKNAAEQKVNAQVNEILQENTMQIDGLKVRKYAAGIGSESAVFASAIAKGREEFGKEVSYQKELANHFKLNAGQIYNLAMANRDVEILDDSGNVVHVFSKDDEYVHDMASDQIFSIGSHSQKMAMIKSTGVGGINYEYRSTIQQAAIKSGIASIAPAISDATYDDILNGKFDGDESWQYHSFRQILEGRLNANRLSTANADSLKMLFAEIDSSTMAREQFNKLIENKIESKLEELRIDEPAATESDARTALLNDFEEQREKVRVMADQVLQTPTIEQNTSAQSASILSKFAEPLITKRKHRKPY